MKNQLLALFVPLFLCFQANALFELRAGYGVQAPAETSFSAGTLTSMMGYNLDAIVELPMVPVGFGLRYEDMGFDYEAGGNQASSSMTRTSLLVNYRIIDFITYVGIIGSLGVVNDAEIKSSFGTAKWDSDFTYSIGVEGGFSLGLFMVGAELGYLGANFKDSGSTGNPDLDLTGVYGKALVGIGF